MFPNLPSFTELDFTTSNEKQWFLRTFVTLENKWNKIKAEQKFHTIAQYFAKWDSSDHTPFISTFYPGVYQ